MRHHLAPGSSMRRSIVILDFLHTGQHWETVYKEPNLGNETTIGKNSAFSVRESHHLVPTPLV